MVSKSVRHIVAFVAFIALSACGSRNEDVATPESRALEYAEALYNFRYADALGLCGDDEASRLRVFVANISKEDEACIRKIESQPIVAIDRVELIANDGVKDGKSAKEHEQVSVTIHLGDVYIMDSIGKVGRMADEAKLRVLMEPSGSDWIVRRADLLQSGK